MVSRRLDESHHDVNYISFGILSLYIIVSVVAVLRIVVDSTWDTKAVLSEYAWNWYHEDDEATTTKTEHVIEHHHCRE